MLSLLTVSWAIVNEAIKFRNASWMKSSIEHTHVVVVWKREVRVPALNPRSAGDCCHCWRFPTVLHQSSICHTPTSGCPRHPTILGPPRGSCQRWLHKKQTQHKPFRFAMFPSCCMNTKNDAMILWDLPFFPRIARLIPGSLSLMNGEQTGDESPFLASSKFFAQMLPWAMFFSSYRATMLTKRVDIIYCIIALQQPDREA